MVFQQIPPHPSRIVLQATNLWKEYMRLRHPMKETLATNDPSLRSLVNADTIIATTLQKRKVILPTRPTYVGQSHVYRNTHRRSTLSLLDGCHWRPPDSRRFKLHVDASWSKSNARYGALFGTTRDRYALPSPKLS